MSPPGSLRVRSFRKQRTSRPSWLEPSAPVSCCITTGLPSRPAWREPGIGRRRTAASASARPRPSRRWPRRSRRCPRRSRRRRDQRRPGGLIVLSLAERIPADLIVIGSHGWSTEEHASITERIIAGAPCPVLSLHEGGEWTEPLRLVTVGGAPPRVVVPTDFSPPRGTPSNTRTPLTNRSAASRAAGRAARRTPGGGRRGSRPSADRRHRARRHEDAGRHRHPPGSADNRGPGAPGEGSAAVRGSRGALAPRPSPPVHAGYDVRGHA